MKNIDEAFQWIESFTNFQKHAKGATRKYRVERMQLLLDHFGHPERAFKSIHAAGSKGKGSTCALLAGALNSQGFKTGLYSSPHVRHYRERFCINGTFPADGIFVSLIRKIRENLPSRLPGEEGDEEPTTFELLTLTAFLLFKEQNCQWAVIETGLGGRLDATNVLFPEAVVLTPMELEHTSWLGNTLAEIAREKAGIIKEAVPVFCAPQEEEALVVVRKQALKMHCPFTLASHGIERVASSLSIEGSRYAISCTDGTRLEGRLKLCGREQVWNMILALKVLKGLFPSRMVRDWLPGMENVHLSARMEILNRKPLWICDGAHTSRSVSLALNAFFEICKAQGIENKYLLFACQDDKDFQHMAGILAPSFDRVIITRPGSFKKSHPAMVYESFKKAAASVHLEEELPSAFTAVRSLCKSRDALLILGSFFLAGEIQNLLSLPSEKL